jgi:hypothetical protein
MTALRFGFHPVPRTLRMFTGDDDEMFVISGIRDQVTGRTVGYMNTRRGNRAFVRDLLADKQPAFAAALELAVAGVTAVSA